MTAQAAYPSLLDDRHRPRPLAGLTAWVQSGLQTLLFRNNTAVATPLFAPMARPSETAASATVSDGTSKRFQTIIVPHLDSAYNFARFLCRDPDAASDIVQEAFLRAFRSFEGYHGGDPRAWMFAIIRNCYRAWHVEGRRRAHFEMPLGDGGEGGDTEQPGFQVASEADTPEMATIQQSEAARVRRVIAGLAEPLREVLVLRELEDLSYKQISGIIDAPIGTVMSRLARARAEFGQAWRALEQSGAGR